MNTSQLPAQYKCFVHCVARRLTYIYIRNMYVVFRHPLSHYPGLQMYLDVKADQNISSIYRRSLGLLNTTPMYVSRTCTCNSMFVRYTYVYIIHTCITFSWAIGQENIHVHCILYDISQGTINNFYTQGVITYA